MTHADFLDYIGETCVRAKGKAYTNLVKSRHVAYRKAYSVKTFEDAYFLHLDRPNYYAVKRGLRDRDTGLPMAELDGDAKESL